MATRVAVTKTVLPGPYDYLGVLVVFEAADTVDKNKIVLTGKEVILAKNVGASPATVTVTSVADPYGRTKDISAVSVAAGVVKAFGPFTNRQGWLQTDGSLYFEASAADIEFAVLVIP